jgi:AAA15 family ATPase/GTPase
MQIHVKSFKKIAGASIKLKSINIFIGANNAGKSSFIQGIQFAISSCQTLNLKGGNWTKQGKKTLSLDSNDFLYTPTKSIEYLHHGKKLTGSQKRVDRTSIAFTFTQGASATVKISKGKNGGFTTELEGKALGEKLSDIENPYCVYVPGIAGIPTQERYEVAITVKKSATRGDSNNYLRNILLSISKTREKWSSFEKSVNAIYSNISLTARFDGNKSEDIEVEVTVDGLILPLDAIGTGLLQVIQIFAYIEYFNPVIILLDEPDSHIHPTKQKLLAQELARIAAANKELRIVFSTHSRYILESLEDKANVVHFQDGKIFENVKGSNILLDIGAADADYLFKKKTLKYVFVTEDKVDNIKEKKEFLKKFLLSNGFKEEEFVLHSYEGCTKIDFAKILEGFVKKHIPTAQVIVHIDRDQKVDTDREILKLKADCTARGLILFVTKYQEIESYFCTPGHISNIYNIPIEVAKNKYEQFIDELEVQTKDKLKNFVLREREELLFNPDGRKDIKVLERMTDAWYDEYRDRLTLGKELLGKVKNYAQTELKKDPNEILGLSQALACHEFRQLFLEPAPP